MIQVLAFPKVRRRAGRDLSQLIGLAATPPPPKKKGPRAEALSLLT